MYMSKQRLLGQLILICINYMKRCLSAKDFEINDPILINFCKYTNIYINIYKCIYKYIQIVGYHETRGKELYRKCYEN